MHPYEMIQISVLTQKIRKSFFRKDKQCRKNGIDSEKDTGLGSILCKEFVEKNGGTISLESDEEKGGKFTFTVPLYANTSNEKLQ